MFVISIPINQNRNISLYELFERYFLQFVGNSYQNISDINSIVMLIIN